MKLTVSRSLLTGWLVRMFAAALLVAGVAVPVQAAPSAATTTYTITGNTPGFIKRAKDLGPLDPSTTITVDAWLKLQNQNSLDNLAQQQHQKGSPNYHKWINQSQFNSTYSPTSQQVNAFENFAQAHGLIVVSVAEDNFYVQVQGTVSAIEKAFHVQIDQFAYNGDTYRSNTSDPSISDPSGAQVAAITGLDDFGFQPDIARATTPEGEPVQPVPLSKSANGEFFAAQCFYGTQTQTFKDSTNTATYTGNRYGADITNTKPGTLGPCGYSPADLRKAYNLSPLYGAGLDGSGQTVVVVDAFGSATIQNDAAVFSDIYGLPAITSSNFQVVKSPGLVNNKHGAGWDGETTLDVEWVHAIAPGAKIVLVTATAQASLDEAINYAVIHHLGNTISNSWSSREGFGNPAQFDRVNRILEMAAVQGVDVNFSSGDNGDETTAVGFKTVDFPASSPYATGIGGTSLGVTSTGDVQFETGWGTNLTRIANTNATGNAPYVPPQSTSQGYGFQFGAGGGPSLTFAKPDFQSSLPGTTRQVPDVAWLADPYTGVEIIQTIDGQLSVSVIGGTSLACPMFSGLMAIAAQKAGHPLGQAAPLLYSAPSAAFKDITAVSAPDNVVGTVNGTSYSAAQLAAPLYSTTQYVSALYNSPFSTRWYVITFNTDTSLLTTSGWDNVTGLGVPNGATFVNDVGQ